MLEKADRVEKDDKKYKEVATLREPEGVVCVITERSSDDGPRHTFGFFKEFVKDAEGDVSRTSFFGAKHLPALIRLLPKVDKKLRELREQNKKDTDRRPA